jgi:hypothetical protein
MVPFKSVTGNLLLNMTSSQLRHAREDTTALALKVLSPTNDKKA